MAWKVFNRIVKLKRYGSWEWVKLGDLCLSAGHWEMYESEQGRWFMFVDAEKTYDNKKAWIMEVIILHFMPIISLASSDSFCILYTI